MDTMIQGQLGSLTSSTPSAPSWEAKRDEAGGGKCTEILFRYVTCHMSLTAHVRGGPHGGGQKAGRTHAHVHGGP